MKNNQYRTYVLTAAYAALLTAASPTYSASTSSIDNAEPESSVYEVFESPWIDNQGEISTNAAQLLSQIQQSHFHGLNPENYQLSKIVKLEQLLTSGNLSTQERHDALSQLESSLDDAYYKLAKHLGSSLIEGQDVQTYIFRKSPTPDLDVLYESLSMGEQTMDEVFESITPTHTEYTDLQRALGNLLHEKDADLGRTFVPTTETLSVGDENEVVRAAKLRLIETSDYSGSSGVDSFFDELFKDAVISFQNRHHITPTGVLDEETVETMNRSVDQDITQVVVSLERWRWMPRELGTQRVIANVPDFRIRMFNGEEKIADMATVVGKLKHRTPLFSETIKHVVAAPTWTVPASIANNELAPAELRNPGYLQSKNYELLRWEGNKAHVVPFNQVSRSAYSRKRFPYTIRQKAGSNNALGDVKILMPNKYAIYFHDTQAKKLFSEDHRAFSHGCVRLHDPQRLASLIMQVDGESQNDTTSFLASKKTRQYNLKNPIDSHIVYFTTFVDSEGKLNFRNDVYGYDKKITDALQSNSLLGILNSDVGDQIFANTNLAN